MNINEYIARSHDDDELWFIEETKEYKHQKRIQDVQQKREYLKGEHKIKQRLPEHYNGTLYEPRKIVLQYAKTILNFQTSYLLKNPVTLSGDKDIVNEYKKVYKKGKYHKIDFDILDNIAKYGDCYEYVYVQDNVIKSKLILPENAFPIYNFENEMVAFVEYYVSDYSDYYTVYYSDHVQQWSNVGTGDMRIIGIYNNVSGLPIHYKSKNETDNCFGQSDLDDIISILDNMEDILSKFTDSFYKHHNPIPVAIGQQLKGQGLNPNIVGGGILLDDGADFKMVTNQLDYLSFEGIYKTLKQALLDISNTPAVSMNNTDVSNLSEVSMKLLFQLADIKAGLNEMYMRDGMQQRFDKWRGILDMMGVTFKDEAYDTLDVVYMYSRPTNEKDVIDNLVALRGIGGIGIETVLENSPFTTNVEQELERIGREVDRKVETENGNDKAENGTDEEDMRWK